MKFVERLDLIVEKNKSRLCIGLDIDLSKLDKKLLETDDPIFSFNKKIIDQTSDLVCAYKPNSAFYEACGIYGIEALIRTIEYIRTKDIPVILDAKRGDIGNTAAAYAKFAFDICHADAVTVNPYMGYDSIAPFLNYKDKGIFILCLTSNPGSKDFQNPLYLTVAKKVVEWNKLGNCGLVVGATNPEELKKVTDITKDMPILIPGVGSQGGSLELSVKYGGKRAMINVSRNVIYSEDPRKAAIELRDNMISAS